MADVTAELQSIIDAFPDCFFADDMANISQTFAKRFQASAEGDQPLLADINELLMVGKELRDEGGEGPDPAHSGISGLYCKSSEGRTRFLSAYAKCFRRQWALLEKRGSVWNPKLWADAVKSTFDDVTTGVGKIGEGLGEGLGKVILQLAPLLVVIAVLGVVFLVVQKKVVG